MEDQKPFIEKDKDNTDSANPNEDAKGYGQESILNLKENQSEYPQIITHHVPNRNEPILTENHKGTENCEEKIIEEKDSQGEGSPDRKQQKEEESSEAKLGAEMLDFVWQFIISSYYSKNITAQLIQSVRIDPMLFY